MIMQYKKSQSGYGLIKTVIREVVKDAKYVGKVFCYNFIYGDIHVGDGFPSRNKNINKRYWSGDIKKKNSAESIDDKL